MMPHSDAALPGRRTVPSSTTALPIPDVFCLLVGNAPIQAMVLHSQISWEASSQFMCALKTRINFSAESVNALSRQVLELLSCRSPALPVLECPVPAVTGRDGWTCAGNPCTPKHSLHYASLDQLPSKPDIWPFLPAYV